MEERYQRFVDEAQAAIDEYTKMYGDPSVCKFELEVRDGLLLKRVLGATFYSNGKMCNTQEMASIRWPDLVIATQMYDKPGKEWVWESFLGRNLWHMGYQTELFVRLRECNVPVEAAKLLVIACKNSEVFGMTNPKVVLSAFGK